MSCSDATQRAGLEGGERARTCPCGLTTAITECERKTQPSGRGCSSTSVHRFVRRPVCSGETVTTPVDVTPYCIESAVCDQSSQRNFEPQRAQRTQRLAAQHQSNRRSGIKQVKLRSAIPASSRIGELSNCRSAIGGGGTSQPRSTSIIRSRTIGPRINPKR